MLASIAERLAHKPAVVIAASGASITYAELDERSDRLAGVLHERGLRAGDHVALLLGNELSYLECVWAALRSGLYLTPINSHLQGDEAAYIVGDCGAKALISSNALAEAAAAAATALPDGSAKLIMGGGAEGFEIYEDVLVAGPRADAPRDQLGDLMLYSSGTTGRPKGIKRALQAVDGDSSLMLGALYYLFGFGEGSRYLSPGPLYHAAPLGAAMGITNIGGTVYLMDRFEATQALEHMEHYQITASQWVPTMFVRMLKLPEEVRQGFDLGAHAVAVHAGAPCPVEVKQSMMSWWGPIIHEYYGGSEVNGLTYVTPGEWLQRPGTVGRAVFGDLHIVGENGGEVPPGETGAVYFGNGGSFEYHNDPEKTRQAYDENGWSTLGDIGFVDEAGYLFLTDRASFMIIRGGVNVYPQETENVLVQHPAVADVAVIGVPDDDLGEAVKAIVEVLGGVEPSAELAAELMAYCTERLARFKCPVSVDFVDQLPRLASGKMAKHDLRSAYWPSDQGQGVVSSPRIVAGDGTHA